MKYMINMNVADFMSGATEIYRKIRINGNVADFMSGATEI